MLPWHVDKIEIYPHYKQVVVAVAGENFPSKMKCHKNNSHVSLVPLGRNKHFDSYTAFLVGTDNQAGLKNNRNCL